MTVNVGNADRLIRGLIGLVLLYLALFSGIAIFASLAVKLAAILIALVMFATAAFRMCPLYSIFGLRTCRS